MTVASRAETLDHALAYTARGWRVVPIKPGGKHPPIDEWQKAATTDPSLVEDFWTAWPRHGIGIATGQQSGIFVLDVDVSDGKQGDETLADLEAEHGPLPDTVECITGSGGRHLYFKYPTRKAGDGTDEPVAGAESLAQGTTVDGQPGDVRQRSSSTVGQVGQDATTTFLEIRNDAGRRLGPGLDIRGEGGQVLAPPTVHPNGQPYVWEADHDPMDGVAVAEAPSWLLELLTSAPSGGPRAERTPYTGTPRPGDLYAASVTWPELLQPDGATWLGSRTHHATGIHYEIWARPGADHTSATLNYGGTDCLHVFSPNWPGLEEGGTYSKFAYYALTRHAGNFSAAARAVRQVMPEESARTTSDLPVNEVDEEKNAEPDPFIDWGAFWARDDTAEEWLAFPLVPARRGVAVYAKAKTGKSLLLLDIAASLASGRSCLGQPAKDPIHVMYLDYEMTQEDLYDRLADMGYGPEVDLSHLHYASMPPITALDTAEGASKVVALAEKCKARLVVVDTLSRVITTSEEKDSKGVLALYRYLGGPLKARGITLLRLDHAGKEAAQGARGSSAKNEDVDLVWELTLMEGGVRLRCTHARMSWAGGTKDFARKDDPFRHELVKESITYPDGTKEVAAVMDRLGLPIDITKRKATAALKAAGEGKRASLVVAAIHWRQAEQPVFAASPQRPKSGSRNHSNGQVGNHRPEPFDEIDSEQARNHLGTIGNHLPGQVGTRGGVGTTPPGSQPLPDPDDDPNNSIL